MSFLLLLIYFLFIFFLLFICACFYSSAELEKSTEQVLPERGGEGERVGAGERNDLNSVCTCE
jgi:hypothetical protein